MTQNFPDITGFEKGQNEEPILGGTIGLNKILLSLRETSLSPGNPRWDLYLINVYTLARNAYSSGISFSEFEKVIDRDVDILMVYIGAYMQQRMIIQSTVVFYAPSYKAIPELCLRKHTGQRVEFDSLYDRLLVKLPSNITELTEDIYVRKFIAKTGSLSFPHKLIPDIIRNVYHNERSSGFIGTVMVSHCPIDLHLVKSIPKLNLLERFTGRVLEPQEFGEKIVKQVKVPFNTTTHRLFGDSVHLDPLIKGKHKANLIKLASDKKWDLKTEIEIRKDSIQAFPELNSGLLEFLRL